MKRSATEPAYAWASATDCHAYRPWHSPVCSLTHQELAIHFAPPIRGRCRLIHALTGERLIWVRVSGHRALQQPVEQQPTVAGSTAVEAEGELVEVVVELTVAHRAFVGPRIQRSSSDAMRCTWGSTTCAGSPLPDRFVTTCSKR